jgi:hypothetical protein
MMTTCLTEDQGMTADMSNAPRLPAQPPVTPASCPGARKCRKVIRCRENNIGAINSILTIGYQASFIMMEASRHDRQ